MPGPWACLIQSEPVRLRSTRPYPIELECLAAALKVKNAPAAPTQNALAMHGCFLEFRRYTILKFANPSIPEVNSFGGRGILGKKCECSRLMPSKFDNFCTLG